jgi:alpha-tubulin suppressor-like RCC1 family protein
LGTNDQIDHNLPTLVPFNSDVVVDIACGVLHTAALTQTGDVYLSGSNRRGQVENGTDLRSVHFIFQ